ncbi:MAG: IscS-like cysteine desulfurase [Alphaproteobacteria bacterium MarineAlpha3_Bin3]|nr:MAG: IscS-like cysteine desulfurase [Alphaproteobacteria bacterium MarineAlpha3_Bin3]
MGMKNPVYMDHNATTAVRPEARDAVALALALTGNPSSVHGSGRTARRLVEDARDAVAALVGAEPAWVVFTSGGTEANNLALRVLPKRAPILCSAVEHASVLSVMDGIVEIPVDGDGVVDLGALEALLAGEDTPALVSVMLANNETGVLQPVADVAALAHEHGALIHCDAVQAAGKMAIDFRTLGCDLMSLSAHKIGGPSGVGALVVTSGVEGDLALIPMLRGGGQERGRRAGTENVPGIAGFGAAARAAREGLTDFARLGRWRERIENRLRQHADSRVYGFGAPRLANTSCLTMPGVEAETQVIQLDLAGVAVSAGAACSSGKVEPSRVLAAMGVDANEAATAIRVSLGWNTTEDDADKFVEAWIQVYGQAQAHAA